MAELPVSRLLLRPRVLVFLTLIASVLLFHHLYYSDSSIDWTFNPAQTRTTGKQGATSKVKTGSGNAAGFVEQVSSALNYTNTINAGSDPSNKYLIGDSESDKRPSKGKAALKKPKGADEKVLKDGKEQQAAQTSSTAEEEEAGTVPQKHKVHSSGKKKGKGQGSKKPEASTGSDNDKANPVAVPPHPPADIDEDMSICITVKNQTLMLEEFMRHHYHHMGIRRFYVHDDGTVPPLEEFAFSIPAASITWINHPPHVQDLEEASRGSVQIDYYKDCVREFGHLHKWMGFFDTDEILEMRGAETLREFLESFEEDEGVGAVGVSWLLHNSNGRRYKSEEDSRKLYTSCIVGRDGNDNKAVKSFLKTSKKGQMGNLHCFWSFEEGEEVRQVGEHGDALVDGCGRRPITYDRIALHHFATKSWEDFLEKQNRGHMEGGKASLGWWQGIEDEESYECPELSQYVP